MTNEETTIPSAAEKLRTELRIFFHQRLEGNLRDRDYQRLATTRSVDLYQALVKERLEEGEEVVATHHAVRAHMKLNQSLLRETEQEAVSLFLTERRLIRLRSVLAAERPISGDREDETVIDDVSLDRIRAVRVHREVRLGEALAGAVIIALALLGHDLLLITGRLLVLAGVLGILHAFLLPTRWVEVEVEGQKVEPPLHVIASRRKSGRRLVRRLRGRVRGRA